MTIKSYKCEKKKGRDLNKFRWKTWGSCKDVDGGKT